MAAPRPPTGCARTHRIAVHQLDHGARVPLRPSPRQRRRAHGHRQPKLPRPGWDHGVHDMLPRGGDEDVEGLGAPGRDGEERERVR